jgi:hypothetical protein
MLLKWNSAYEINSVTALDTPRSSNPPNFCCGGEAIARLKVIAHVSQNLLRLDTPLIVTDDIYNQFINIVDLIGTSFFRKMFSELFPKEKNRTTGFREQSLKL